MACRHSGGQILEEGRYFGGYTGLDVGGLHANDVFLAGLLNDV